jgi:DNA-binding response OmpR family regulator
LRPPLRVLCVDDDRLLLEIVTDRLAEVGIEVVPLQQPTLVVPRAKAVLPDLILLDRNMPVLSGPEVMRSLQSFEETKDIPVAFLTGNCTEEDLLKVLRMGAADVMVKPFNADHVRRVRKIIEDAAARKKSPRARPPPLWHNLQSVFRRNLRAGALILNPGTPFEGRIHFQGGEFIHAEYAGLMGESAVEEMLLVEDGAWAFEDESAQFIEDLDILREETHEPTQPLIRMREKGFRPSALLVVEDPVRRKTLDGLLQQQGIMVANASDGKLAHELAIGGHFDFVLMELNIRTLDGWGLLRKLKDDYRTRELTVLCLGVEQSVREALSTAQAGAFAYFAEDATDEEILGRCLSAVSARKSFVAELMKAEGPVNLSLKDLGPLWLLSTLAPLRATGKLDLRDEWGTYSLLLSEGKLLDASTGTSRRLATGMAAVAAVLVSRGAKGTFSGVDPQKLPDAKPQDMEDVLRQATAALNRLEAQVTDRWLSSATSFVVDEPLYDLYRRVANERHVTLARALCEERVPPNALAARVSLPAPEVQEILKDLLRRRVIEFVREL